jgi:feruloyl-CoA synthase
MPDIIRLDTVLDTRADGTIYARCPIPLAPYPVSLTDRLVHWAEHAPTRTFLARRGGDGGWIHMTYAETLARVRSVAQALLDRRLSPDRPVMILSGNSLEHAVLALAAMHVGVLHAPIAPAYALLARDYTTLRGVWQALRPGLVFAAESQRFERALGNVAGDTEIVSCSPSAALRTTSFGELLASNATAAVDDAHAAVTPDTVAKVLYTSGSTGRPKGVINTQRMLCANQEQIRAVMPLLADQPILCDWLPWNHTFGGNHNIGIVLYNGGTLYIDDGKPMPGAFDTTVENLREIPITAYFNVPRGYDLLGFQRRTDRRTGARGRAQAGARRTPVRSPCPGAERHPRILAGLRPHISSLRRRGLLHDGRRAGVLRPAGSVEGIHVRRPSVGGLQAVHRNLGPRGSIASAAPRPLRRSHA